MPGFGVYWYVFHYPECKPICLPVIGYQSDSQLGHQHQITQFYYISGDSKAFQLHIQSRRANCKHAVPANSLGAHLNFPECIGAGGRSSWLPQGCSKKNVKLALVFITGEKFLLLCMEQPDHVPLSGKDTKIKFHVQRLWVPAFGDIKIMPLDRFLCKRLHLLWHQNSEPQSLDIHRCNNASLYIYHQELLKPDRHMFITPLSTSSMWSRNCINRLIFQLVLQLTEFT